MATNQAHLLGEKAQHGVAKARMMTAKRVEREHRQNIDLNRRETFGRLGARSIIDKTAYPEEVVLTKKKKYDSLVKKWGINK